MLFTLMGKAEGPDLGQAGDPGLGEGFALGQQQVVGEGFEPGFESHSGLGLLATYSVDIFLVPV